MNPYRVILSLGLISLPCLLFAASEELTFKEDLRFGGGDDPLYIWPDSRVSLAVDPEGHMYVADISESRVLQFDESGTFVGVVIGKGQGPNELEALTNFQILKDGSACAYQYQGRAGLLKFFDANMAYQKSLRETDLGLTPLSMKWSPLGNWVAIEFNERDRATRSIITHVGLLNDQMKLQKRFSSTRMPLPNREKMNQRDFWVSFFKSISQLHFKSRTLFAFDQQGRIYLAESQRYFIERWDSAFRKQEHVYQKNVQKRPWSPTELDQLAEEISLQYTQAYPPELKPFLTTEIVREGLDQADISAGRHPLAGLIVTDDGKLLVVQNEIFADGSQVADVYGSNGQFIGRLRAPKQGLVDTNNRTRMIFRGPYAYTLETLEAGSHQVVRYLVSWKAGP